MIKAIKDIVGGISADIWLYISIGLIAVVFIALLIVIIIAGDVNKFKKAANIVTSAHGDPKAANQSAKKMPIKVTKLYKRVKVTGEKPGDVIGIDAAVNAPYQTSLAPKFALIMTLVSVFAALLAAACVYVSSYKATADAIAAGNFDNLADPMEQALTAAATAAIAGFVLTVCALIVSALFYKGAVKKYDAYISALDAMSKDGGFENVSLDEGNTSPAAEPVQKSAQKPVKEKKAKQPDFEVAEPVSEPAAVNSYPAGNYREAQVFEPSVQNFSYSVPRNNVVLEDTNEAYEAPKAVRVEEAPVIVTPVIIPVAPAAAPVVTPVITPAAEPAVSRPAPNADPAQSYPRTTAAELRARAEAAREMRAQKAAEAAAAEPQGVSGSADEVIKKIEKASAEGAPLSTMKEIALQLQQERAKPENKTPETQKKLSDAQVLLIKAMSSAMRR